MVCMVRPESLAFDRRAENRFAALLKRNVYLGELEQFMLDARGTPIRVVATNPGEETPSVGSEVRLGFSADDAVILRADARTDGGGKRS